MTKPLRVLIAEDSEDDALLLLMELRRNGYEPDSVRVETRDEMLEALGQGSWDIVISDYVMPRFSGLETLKLLRESGKDLPFIIVSGNIGEDIAVNAMKAGAHDYLIKGHLQRLGPAVDRELREAEVRRARRSAEEERDRLAAAVESAAEAVVITDAQGRIQYVNPSFESITGFRRREIEGTDIHDLSDESRNTPSSAGMRRAIESRSAWTGRVTGKKKDGSRYEEECTIAPIRDHAGAVANYVFVKRDITEKLRLESIAQAVDTMNNIGYIFTGVRHEIGNPVNAVITNLNLAKTKFASGDTAAIEKYVDRALTNIERVEYILRTLRSFNLYETPELQNVNVKEFLETFVSLVSEDFEKKSIAIQTAVGNEHTVYADPRIMQQVFLNLFTNAADALKQQKEPRIAVTVLPADGTIRIQVTDNGCGMPEDKLKNLFKPFNTSKAHGTGLGLVIVKKMLTMMNGTVNITSSEGKGTMVEMILPVRDAQ